MPLPSGLCPVLCTALLGTTTCLHAATVLAPSDAAVGVIPAGTPTVYIDGGFEPNQGDPEMGDPHYPFNDGAILDASTDADPNDFNGNLVNNGPNQDNTEVASADTHTIQLTTVPVLTRGGVNYFGFVLDVQETGGNGRPLTIADISIDVSTQSDLSNAVTVWSNAHPIQLNGNLPSAAGGGAQNPVNSPLGSGGDLLLLVPLSRFVGFTSDDYLNFRVTQTDSDNGDDEWALAPGSQFMDPGVVLPEPSSAFLALVAGGCLILRRRR